MAAAGLPLLWLVASLLLYKGGCQVLGDVFLYEAGKGEREPVHFDPFPDLPADFGPEVPDEGIDGLLLVADPEDACQPFKYRYDDEPWVALISRSQHLHPTNCTFDVKVSNAELAGASAAIVYDDVYEALIIMSKPRDHPEPGIPAVFVSEKAGIIMRKLMTPGVTRVRIVPVSASAWMSLLMSAFLGFLALTVVLATFYVMRSWSIWLGRTRRRGMAPELAGFGSVGAQAAALEGLPACAIRALPLLIYEGKSGKRRRSSIGQGPPEAGVGPQQAPSAPVPISASPATGNGHGSMAWMPATPSMPSALHPSAAGRVQFMEHQQQLHPVAGHMQSSAGDAAVVLIESDGEAETPVSGSARDHHSPGLLQQAVRDADSQPSSGLSQRLASSSSAVTSGLISLASLAAAGSRRMLMMGGPASSASPSGSATSQATLAAAAAAAAAGATARPMSGPVDVPVATAVGLGTGQVEPAATGSSCGSPTGSASCHSSIYSTDDEDADMPEVVQSWPGAGGPARVVTGGPVGARGGATRHTCVVCLERYHAGDKVRVLPCQHRFHAKCIDPWLASRRLCPVCKHDASMWPSNSMQAALAGSTPLEAAAGPMGSGPDQVGGVSLMSAPLSAGMVPLGRGYWFRRLRARLARASRRRQQQQQQHEQHPALGGVSMAAPGAAAEAAEAGLLHLPAPPVAADAGGGSVAHAQAQSGATPWQQDGSAGPAAGLGQQQQQQQHRHWMQRGPSELQEPLIPPATSR